MHAIRSDARRQAYADPRNPFSRYRPYRSTDPGRHTAPQRLEEGNGPHTAPDGHRISRAASNPLPEIKVPLEPKIAPSISEVKDQTSRLTPHATSSTIQLIKPDQHEEENSVLKPPGVTISEYLLGVNPTFLLFAFVPAGFVVNYTLIDPTTIFTVNLVAMLPSAYLIDFYVGLVADSIGETLGGLLSITFSNVVLLVSSVFLLKSNQLAVLQASLLGSIISNLLLMTGVSFFLGGIPRIEQFFDKTLAQSLCTLLLLAILSLLIPTASHLLTSATSSNILAQSRGTAIVILFSYVPWLVFQLRTHNNMFRTASSTIQQSQLQPRVRRQIKKLVSVRPKLKSGLERRNLLPPDLIEKENPETTAHDSSSDIGNDSLSRRVSKLVGPVAIIVISTTILAFNTEFATNNIQGLLQRRGISQMFIGFVVLPLVSNDHFSVLSAISDKMNNSLSLTLGRCMQTSLMVVPSVVIIAWCMSKELTLEFDGFSIAALFASMIMVSYVVQEGKSNWLVGALLFISTDLRVMHELRVQEGDSLCCFDIHKICYQ